MQVVAASSQDTRAKRPPAIAMSQGIEDQIVVLDPVLKSLAAIIYDLLRAERSNEISGTSAASGGNLHTQDVGTVLDCKGTNPARSCLDQNAAAFDRFLHELQRPRKGLQDGQGNEGQGGRPHKIEATGCSGEESIRHGSIRSRCPPGSSKQRHHSENVIADGKPGLAAADIAPDRDLVEAAEEIDLDATLDGLGWLGDRVGVVERGLGGGRAREVAVRVAAEGFRPRGSSR